VKLRTLFFWAHLAAGLTAGIVILTISVTGVLLTYERQLIEWSDRGYRSVPPTPDARRLATEALLARAREQRPDRAPAAIALRSDAQAPAALAVGQTTVYQDVYSGELLGESSAGVRGAMGRVRAWHRWLGMEGEQRGLGKAVTGWANLVFLFILLSGLYLWIPRRWSRQKVRAVIVFRRGLGGKARDFNWHNVIGIWCAAPLTIIVACAAPMSFPWANAFVYRIAGDTAPPAANTVGSRRQERPPGRYPDGLNTLWARAEAQVSGWRSINLRLPGEADRSAVFSIDSGTGGQPQRRSTLTLDVRTAALVKWEPFDSQSSGRRLRSWTRFTHTGEYYGLAGQTIAGLVSAGAAILVCTGLALAFRRFLNRWFMAGGRPLEPDVPRVKNSTPFPASSAAARVWTQS
jgi:uncharacterized iron-regulated membrane protein